VKFPVAVGAEDDTLVNLTHDPIPTPSLLDGLGHGDLFLARVQVVELQAVRMVLAALRALQGGFVSLKLGSHDSTTGHVRETTGDECGH